MYPVLIQLGTFELRSYGVIVALSFLLGLWLSTREAKRKGLDPALIQDFAFYALLGGIVGARVYYVVFSDPAHFLRKPWEILAVWHGGLGIIGALVGDSWSGSGIAGRKSCRSGDSPIRSRRARSSARRRACSPACSTATATAKRAMPRGRSLIRIPARWRLSMSRSIRSSCTRSRLTFLFFFSSGRQGRNSTLTASRSSPIWSDTAQHGSPWNSSVATRRFLPGVFRQRRYSASR